VPNVACVSGLYNLDCPFVFVLFIVYNHETQAPLGTGNRAKIKGQSRIYNPETQATLGTRNRTKTKGQSRIYNPETQATLGTGNRAKIKPVSQDCIFLIVPLVFRVIHLVFK
jgi:hypothetical protein